MAAGQCDSAPHPPAHILTLFLPPLSFEAIVARLNTEPGTTEGMDELEKYTAVVEGQLEEFGAKIEFAKQVGGDGGHRVCAAGGGTAIGIVCRGGDEGCASNTGSLV